MEDRLNNEIRRIFLKFIMLKIISERPIHGYDIIKEVEQRSNGRWTPSPGSIYPSLDSFESKGWIVSEDIDRRKVYTITPKGSETLERLKKKWREQMQEIAGYLEAIIEEDAESTTSGE